MKLLNLLVLSFFIYIFNCNAQDSLSKQKINYSIGTSFIGTGNTQGWGLTPYVSFRKSVHKIGIGPILGRAPYLDQYYSNYNIDTEGSMSLMGGNIFYNYYPNFLIRNFDIFIENRLSYIPYEISTSIRKIHSFEYLIGLGIKATVLKRITFHYPAILIGTMYKKSKYPHSYYNSNRRVKVYSPFQISAGLIAGIEVNF